MDIVSLDCLKEYNGIVKENYLKIKKVEEYPSEVDKKCIYIIQLIKDHKISEFADFDTNSKNYTINNNDIKIGVNCKGFKTTNNNKYVYYNNTLYNNNNNILSESNLEFKTDKENKLGIKEDIVDGDFGNLNSDSASNLETKVLEYSTYCFFREVKGINVIPNDELAKYINYVKDHVKDIDYKDLDENDIKDFKNLSSEEKNNEFYKDNSDYFFIDDEEDTLKYFLTRNIFDTSDGSIIEFRCIYAVDEGNWTLLRIHSITKTIFNYTKYNYYNLKSQGYYFDDLTISEKKYKAGEKYFNSNEPTDIRYKHPEVYLGEIPFASFDSSVKFLTVKTVPDVDDMQPGILYLKNSVRDIYQGYYLIIADDGTKSIGQIGGRSYEGKNGITVDTETAEISNDLVTSGGDIGGNVNVKGTAEIQSDLTVNGNIYQKGEVYETHTENLYTKKDVIITRENAENPLADDEFSGIVAKHYDADGNDGVVGIFNDGIVRLGDKNDLQPIATRNESKQMKDNAIVKWDSQKNCLRTCESVEDVGLSHTFDTIDEYRNYIAENGIFPAGTQINIKDGADNSSLINDDKIASQSTWSSNKLNDLCVPETITTISDFHVEKIGKLVIANFDGCTLSVIKKNLQLPSKRYIGTLVFNPKGTYLRRHGLLRLKSEGLDAWWHTGDGGETTADDNDRVWGSLTYILN